LSGRPERYEPRELEGKPKPKLRPGERPCRHCGTPFIRGTNQAQRRFCDDVCKVRAARRRKLGLPESVPVTSHQYDLINIAREDRIAKELHGSHA
jgi:hypothetical protein